MIPGGFGRETRKARAGRGVGEMGAPGHTMRDGPVGGTPLAAGSAESLPEAPLRGVSAFSGNPSLENQGASVSFLVELVVAYL